MLDVDKLKKRKKSILKKVRALSDKDLLKVIEIFDVCQECWMSHPEKCKYRPIRKRLGLDECHTFEVKQMWRKRAIKRSKELKLLKRRTDPDRLTPDEKKRIKRALRDIKEGRIYTHEEMKEIVKKMKD